MLIKIIKDIMLPDIDIMRILNPWSFGFESSSPLVNTFSADIEIFISYKKA